MDVMMKRDLNMAFELHNCRRWQNREDMLAGIRLAIQHAQLIPLENRFVPVNDNKNARPVVQDLTVWFDSCWRVNQEWDAIEFKWFRYQEHWSSFFRVPLEDEWQTDQPLYGAVEMLLDARRFGETYNHLDFGCTLFGKSKMIPERQPQLGYADALGRAFLAFARPVIEHFKPDYAVISDNHHFAAYGQDILAARLPYIHWCNYLGPAYLDHYKEAVFQTAPGWKVEKWADGLWYQVTENFSSFGIEERQAVAAHFKPSGIQPAGMVQYVA